MNKTALGTALVVLVALAWPCTSLATVITVSAKDSAAVNIAKIEGAGPGDEVVVEPGTYKFRLYLTKQGTAQTPIVIRAQDPAKRPVWDLAGKVIADWPGSYTGGDKGRAIWHIGGAFYRVSGIIFRGGTDGGMGDGGGIRFKGSNHVTLHDCLFQFNDNGIQGAGDSTEVEFCEFDQNGLPGSTDGSHNLYIHGGSLRVRYCYIHDARRSQNMHIRANDSVFEYNWIARSKSYMGDMMPCSMGTCEDEQTMLLRGNVFLRGTPENDGQVFVLYNDKGVSNKTLKLTMINNTVIGNGDAAALVHFGNKDPGKNKLQTANLHNNVFYNVSRVFRTDDAGLSNWKASGSNNWVSTGTKDLLSLAGTVKGADPGLKDIAKRDLVPAAGSPLIGAAAQVADLPTKEYYLSEVLKLGWRPRLTALDIGAFESTTKGAPVGPYGTTDTGPDAGPGADGGGDGSPKVEAGQGAEAGAGEPRTGGDDGCGCVVFVGGRASGPSGDGHALLLLLILLVSLPHLRRD